MNKIFIFDSTLRDGAQGEGISFSVGDKLKIVELLDSIGIEYIEAGNPGSNSKDLEFFSEVKKMNLKNSKLTAFGSTRRKNIKIEDDANIKALLSADTPAIAIFGKSWDFHVTDIIRTSLEENLKMIEDTVSYLVKKDKEVIYDAEHFFDGYKANPDYALETLNSAVKAGASVLSLCDTNGGTFPDEISTICEKVKERFPDTIIGIHCHNDTGMAVANSIFAVKSGVRHIQGTFLGFGERCGNANLSTIIANLQVKLGYNCIDEKNMEKLTDIAKKISEISNVIMPNNTPYVGNSAFAHKGGMHIDGVNKASHSFEHTPPESVGNRRRFLMSEVSGRGSILSSVQKIDPSITKDSPEAQEIIDELKRLEHQGYHYEGAESSFELVVMKVLGRYKPKFNIDFFKTIVENDITTDGFSSSSMIKVSVEGKEEITAAQGKGPVDALDKALRKALEVFYPVLKDVYLTDYKVRVLDTEDTTSAMVRVLIESTDGKRRWTTIGISYDIIEASLIALKDSIEYKLISIKD
ncbi:MAG: citramalate synthase [Andreesenia angusta]|nr:citramalate synthase [Andreesenia angusta]